MIMTIHRVCSMLCFSKLISCFVLVAGFTQKLTFWYLSQYQLNRIRPFRWNRKALLFRIDMVKLKTVFRMTFHTLPTHYLFQERNLLPVVFYIFHRTILPYIRPLDDSQELSPHLIWHFVNIALISKSEKWWLWRGCNESVTSSLNEWSWVRISPLASASVAQLVEH